MPADALHLRLTADDLEWSRAVRRNPGSVVDVRIVCTRLHEGRYEVVSLIRAKGLPPSELDVTVQGLRQRYAGARIERLGADDDAAFVRTSFRLDDLGSFPLRFLSRFLGSFRVVLLQFHGDRMDLWGPPLVPGDAPEMAERIRALMRKAGIETTVDVLDASKGPPGTMHDPEAALHAIEPRPNVSEPGSGSSPR